MKNWYQDNPPIYDIEKSYEENAAEGPYFDGDIPERTMPPESEWKTFLGHKIASPLGVPAGPLLNSKWTTLAANLGFDVVSYKTIRSIKRVSHAMPNMVYVDTEAQLSADKTHTELTQATEKPADMTKLAVTNSFGMPSSSREFLVEDIAKAKAALQKGQLMIVSVVGTPGETEDLADDYVAAAEIALAGGAEVIEANFSCPNVVTGEGHIYTNPDTVAHIAKKLVAVLGDVPLVIKIGVFQDKALMREVLIAAAGAGVQAVCGINTIGMKVVDGEEKRPALGKGRETSGICGGPIFDEALRYTKLAKAINEEEKLGLTIMTCGGIVAPQQFDAILEAGADLAMSATGMMWDPYLAHQYHTLDNK